ncbi:tripartite tricarboxylate transporter substrate binding protein [Verticiella sediminum]|uniref:Tripartite tricarboxylate transporter substrate binding protein n=1 Tax=Verticiella sediminum TaxID=1247510 RepID=A0A556A7G7_9BURK|nr:tripartite tricarboxylate transporter substrate binding protein [Verticiella sediminum]TSH88836.1 tripartite tricarboxylate transporter substrate binding protein [Verticiella sediminum]
MSTKNLITAGLLGVGLLCAAGAQAAEPWPKAKPVTFIITSAAGGGTDTMGRLVADRLSKVIGQTIIVESKPGANGMIGNDTVARAKPDGYTLSFTYAAAIVSNKLLMPNLPHDPQTDLTPIAQIGAGGNLLVVSKEFPAKDFAGMLEEVKAKPDVYSYGSWGNGSGGHITMEAIKQQTGLKMQHVPYKGVQPSLIDMVGGRLPIAFVDSSSSLPMIQSGQIVPIANSGKTRAPMNPDVPTLTELGIDYDAESWYGVFGPKGMDPELVAQINTAVNTVLKDPEMIERFRQLNMTAPADKNAQAFADTIANDLKVWGDVIQAADITLD